MSVAGPELPPHLAAKRKRQTEEEAEQPVSRSGSSTSNNNAGQKRRVLGPSLPPAPLEELLVSKANTDGDSESEYDIGPSLPPPPGQYDIDEENTRIQTAAAAETLALETSKKPQREDWMLVPPKKDDLSSRFDPTKLKSRKFNSGKGAKGPVSNGGTESNVWTETPEEKRKRLQDEIMGTKKPAHLAQTSPATAINLAKARETDQRIREYNVGRWIFSYYGNDANVLAGKESRFIVVR
jgi:hypothetical protein